MYTYCIRIIILIYKRTEIRKIIISEEEQSVMDSIQSKLKRLHNVEQRINELNESYTQSCVRIRNNKSKQLDVAETEVIKSFDELTAALNGRKTVLLKQIEEMKDADDEKKENSLLQESTKLIRVSRQYLNSQLELCEELTLVNDNRPARKSKIINIGRCVVDKFSSTDVLLSGNIDDIQKQINDQNSSNRHIQFRLIDKARKFMKDDIANIGQICTEEKDEHKHEFEHKYQDEQENMVEIDIDNLYHAIRLLQKAHEFSPEAAEDSFLALKNYIIKLGNAYNDAPMSEKDKRDINHGVIFSLINLHRKIKNMIQTCLNNNASYLQSLKCAFEEIMNKDDYNKIATLLAKFTHDILKKGAKIMESDLEDTMDGVVTLYSYIRDKCMFFITSTMIL